MTNREHPSVSIDKLLKIVPDKHKPGLEKLRKDFLYKTTEHFDVCHYELIEYCNKLLIDEEWKRKMISLFTGLPVEEVNNVIED